jgi:hypothetical protein
LARDYPAALRFIWDRVLPGLARVLTMAMPTINPAPKAGQALARLVVDPAIAPVTSKYFPSHTRWQAAASSDASYDTTRAGALWDASTRMSRLAATESPLASAAQPAELPNVGAVLAPILQRVRAEHQPLLIALAERAPPIATAAGLRVTDALRRNGWWPAQPARRTSPPGSKRLPPMLKRFNAS